VALAYATELFSAWYSGNAYEWFAFRKPSSAVVGEARRVAAAEGRRGVRDFGAEIVKAFSSGDDDDKAARRAAKLAREMEFDPELFDRAVLLGGCTIDGQAVKGAVVDWEGPGYKNADGRPVPVCAESIADLDEATARWAHQYVIDLMKPPSQEGDKSLPAAAAPGA